MESRDINERITYWRSMCENWSKNESKPEHYINDIQEFLMALVSEFAKVKIEEIPKRFPQAGPLLNKLFHLNAVRSNTITCSLLLRCVYYFTKKSAPAMEERGLNWAAQRIKSVHNTTKHTNLDKMLSILGFSYNAVVQSNTSCQARDVMVKLDLFESKLLTMDTFTARKVLRELSESMIPLLDDEAYWPLAERIISCHGTLLTTSATSHDDDALVESMDIIEDELDTRQEEDLIVMENLGLKRQQRSKGINLLDLPIGSIDSQKIHGPSQEELYDDLHPQFLKRVLVEDLYQKCSSKTKAVLWTKYPSLFYDEVYNIIEDATKSVNVSTQVERMTEVFCYRPALFQYVISVLRALFKDTQHRVVVKVCRMFLVALVASLSCSNPKTQSAGLDLFFDADQVSLVQQIAFGRTATDRQVISILANYK